MSDDDFKDLLAEVTPGILFVDEVSKPLCIPCNGFGNRGSLKYQEAFSSNFEINICEGGKSAIAVLCTRFTI